jgi:uncharacterized alpha-E superfamily protein
MILDKIFPRSVFYCVLEAENCLRNITGNTGRGFTVQPEKTIGELRSRLEFTSVEEIINFGMHQYIDDLQHRIINISNEINDSFFQLKNNFVATNFIEE